MTDLLNQTALFPLLLTLGAYQVGLWCQKKWKTPLCNPILIGVLLVLAGLFAAGIPNGTYQAAMAKVSWLMTPATVCLAIPLYEQLAILKDKLAAIGAGVAAGTVCSLGLILVLCGLFGLDQVLTVSLLPKSITSAMGMVLSEQAGGMGSLTTAAIILSGILGSLAGTTVCRWLHLTDPVAQGVAFGTASHVIGTARATQLDPLMGAVGSLSLTVAGVLTAVLLPLFLRLTG